MRLKISNLNNNDEENLNILKQEVNPTVMNITTVKYIFTYCKIPKSSLELKVVSILEKQDRKYGHISTEYKL